ncbi:hypothetical protein ACGFOU_25900 [Streptomyces sp. NPDC048595]|uniref:hypothetical protein n=1 Tax=Streptomyces sp. NPDC048595 TaxID=3365576 RepID=UPI00371BF191
MNTHKPHTAASVVLVAAVPVATWGLIGRQDAPGYSPSELDHAVQPLPLAESLETSLGVICLVLAVVSGALLAYASRSDTFDRGRWMVLLPLLVAGLIVGAGWRVLTAGVIGANIGAGLVIWAGGPVTAALLFWALFAGLKRHDGGEGRNSRTRKSTV